MGVGGMIADLDDGFDYDDEYGAEEEESKSQTTTSTRKWRTNICLYFSKQISIFIQSQ